MNEIFNELKLKNSEFFYHHSVENVFSKEECEIIINMSQNLPSQHSKFDDLGRNIRNSEIYWLYLNEKSDWIFERVVRHVAELNNKKFKFDLDGDILALQLTKYSLNQKYLWHVDVGPEELSRRKLTASVQLTSPNLYNGGELQFFRSEHNIAVALNTQGSMTVFPSWLTHQATSITDGERWSLVGWFSGPPFR